MPQTPAPLRPEPGDVLVLVGTTKGAFLFHGSPKRDSLEQSGPHFPGRAVYALAYDSRAGRSRLYSSARSEFFGTDLHFSDDFGATWSEPPAPLVAFPDDTGTALRDIWQIALPPAQPDTVLVGVEPAALFRSDDAGTSFSLVRPLWDHPHRERWAPGAGGLCLHTVLPHPDDPQRLSIAISAAGFYRSADGGASWAASNTGIRADFMPEPAPEFGQCVHKAARDATTPDRLFLQNHGGLYRSDDDGATWVDIANGVPSDFGFAMVTHPRDAGTAYCIPLESAGWRATPEGRARVYRTNDSGASWTPLSNGLPQQDAHLTVLRDAFTADPLEPAGLWFGTRGGQLFGSADEGETWSLYAGNLPPVTCVKTAVVG